jgi:hypothetical protein
VVLSNPVQFKGNLLFKEYGANYLNQDLIVLSRRLETADLQVVALREPVAIKSLVF